MLRSEMNLEEMMQEMVTITEYGQDLERKMKFSLTQALWHLPTQSYVRAIGWKDSSNTY